MACEIERIGAVVAGQQTMAADHQRGRVGEFLRRRLQADRRDWGWQVVVRA